jgi:hypothetical protein
VIDGERGVEILHQIVLHRMDALLDGDVLTTSLIGVCVADALRKGESPKTIAWQLYDGLPSDSAWENHVRDQVIEAVEGYEEAA